MKKLRKRPSGEYTFSEEGTVTAYPPKYSPADKYGDYRRKAKEESK
ncbi:MAG: ribosome biogenesis protein [Candidatus Diapherotrites archaeon]|nr:ribosome biogenesis protein [Candidatus Diapherotrites archaeon]